METDTNVWLSIITLIGTAVSGVITWYLKNKAEVNKVVKANEKLSKIHNEFFVTQTWVAEAVRYAEQKFAQSEGAKKYNEVLSLVAKKASQYGIDITVDDLELLIEAEVNRIKGDVKNVWNDIVGSGQPTNPTWQGNQPEIKQPPKPY